MEACHAQLVGESEYTTGTLQILDLVWVVDLVSAHLAAVTAPWVGSGVHKQQAALCETQGMAAMERPVGIPLPLPTASHMPGMACAQLSGGSMR
jgi:hypothetical protein